MNLIKCHLYKEVTRVFNTVSASAAYSGRETRNSENSPSPEVAIGFLFVFDDFPRLNVPTTTINIISILHSYSTQVQDPPSPLINTYPRTYYYNYTTVLGRGQKKKKIIALPSFLF